MRTIKIMAAFMLFLAINPIYSGWGDWEKTVLGCQNYFPTRLYYRSFQASADYTCFSNSEYPNIPIIPERYTGNGVIYRINRLLYQGDETPAEVNYKEIVIDPLTTKQSIALPILTTCSYIEGVTEYCVGVILRYVLDVNDSYTWKIIAKAVDIPADPENEMTWIGDESSIDSADDHIISADVAGDDFGYVHLVTAETSLNYFGVSGRDPDWTTNLYYSRWNAHDLEWDIDHYLLPPMAITGCIMRNPDVACDSQGNVHVIYAYNSDPSSSDYGIGYCKIEFDQYGVSNVTTDTIAQDGFGYMCESPDITVDDLNRPHVVFQRSGGNTTDWRVYYTTKSGMELWLAPTQVPPPQGTYYYYWEPSITICHGYIHVVYAGAVNDGTFTTSNDRIYYTRKSLTGMLFENPVELSSADDYTIDEEYNWEAIFPWDAADNPKGYANMNRFPCVIAGDDEISIVWFGNDFGYCGPAAILARRCCWEDE